MNKKNASPRRELSARRVLVDGSVAGVAMSAIIVGSLAYDPAIWYNDYPQEMKDKAGPQSAKARRLSYLLMLPFITIFAGSLIVSNMLLKRQNGGRLSFRAALLNSYSLFTVLNLVDTVLLDYLLFTKVQPRFVFLPGTEEMNMADYGTPAAHAKNFLKGCIWGAVAALPIAWFTSRAPGD